MLNKKGEVAEYIRCPRCELNFIRKKDKLCSVCKREMEMAYHQKGEDDLDLGVDFEVCPVCKTNFIREDEDMCASCVRERDIDRVLHGTDVVETDAVEDEFEGEQDSKEEDEFGDMVGVTDEDELDVELDDLDLDISIEEDEMDFEDLESEEEIEEDIEEDDFEDDFLEEDDFDEDDDEDD